MTRRRGREPSRPEVFFDHFRGALSRAAGRAHPGDAARACRRAGPRRGGARPRAPRGLRGVSAVVRRGGSVSRDGADRRRRTDGCAAARRAAAGSGGRAGVRASAAAGERYALDGEGRVVRTDAGADERALAGSSFARWLDATVAREQVLYGPDGEYAPDVFDPSGEEVTPLVALRQAERALKQDPGAAGAAHARGLALRRLGRLAAAVDALDEATALDPENPWPWFDLGRTALDDGQNARAVKAFCRAAELDAGTRGRTPAGLGRAGRGRPVPRRPGCAPPRSPATARWSSRSAAPSTRRRRIRMRRPKRRRRRCWRRSRPGRSVAARRRLPIVTELAAPPPPPARPRRPRPAAPPRSGGPRRGS